MTSSSTEAWQQPAQPLAIADVQPDSDSDEVMGMGGATAEGCVVHLGQAANLRGHPPLSLHHLRPPLAVLLVGAARGRWKAELEGASRAGQEHRASLQDTLGHLSGQGESACIVGMAVLEAWRFVHGQASSAHTFHLMRLACASTDRRRKLPHFLEHMVLAAAVLHGQPLDIQGHSCAARDQPLLQTPPSQSAALQGRIFQITHGGHVGDTLTFAALLRK